MRRAATIGAVALAAAACPQGDSTAPVLSVVVARTETDTIRLAVPLVMRRCRGGGLVLEAVDRGAGMTVWLTPGTEPDSGSYTVALPAAGPTRRAGVAVRFFVGRAPHVVTLDSGAVQLSPRDGGFSGTVGGSGLDATGATRPVVTASFAATPAPRDTLACTSAP